MQAHKWFLPAKKHSIYFITREVKYMNNKEIKDLDSRLEEMVKDLDLEEIDPCDLVNKIGAQ